MDGRLQTRRYDMKKSKVIVVAMLSALPCLQAWPDEVTASRAEEFADAWSHVRARCMPRLRHAKARPSVRTVRNRSDRALFHVANLPEGGFVVMSGDTALRPVVAYSDTGTFEGGEGNPIYDLLVSDMSDRIAAVDAAKGLAARWLSGEKVARIKAMASYGEDGLPDAQVEDVRVAPIAEAKWTQNTLHGENAFNLYTPNNYPCGCVATAFLTVMRHWCEPSGNVAQATKTCWVDGVKTYRQMMGGIYDWESMPVDQFGVTDHSQLEAIGRLAHDVSLAMYTSYWPGAGSTCGELAAAALRDTFGYASVRVYDAIGSASAAVLSGKNIVYSENYCNAILASLDAGMPVVVGMMGLASHQLVIDGYGFSSGGVLFCHLNCGWGGQADLWYNVMAGGIVDPFWFTSIDDVTYNIHPHYSGDVLSGRVLDEGGAPVSGIAVKLSRNGSPYKTTTTNAKGMFSFRFSGKGTFSLEASDDKLGMARRTVSVGAESCDPNFSFDESKCAVTLYSAGVVANRWGQDLVLSEKRPEYYDDPFAASAAEVFSGCVFSGTDMVGTIEVKAGKAKNGTSKLTASVIQLGVSKKLSYKGDMKTDTGLATLSCKGYADMSLFLGATMFAGEMANGLEVAGARNLFLSKNKAESSAAESILAPAIGNVNIVGDNVALAVNIGKKGKVKVSGTYDGVKVSATVQAYIDADGSVLVPVVVTKKVSLAFLLVAGKSGVSVSGLGDGVVVGKQGALKQGSVLQLPDDAFGTISGLRAELLPYNEPLTIANGKWGTAKAAKVAYKNGELTVAPATKGGAVENPSALKLTYKAKDGSFKGSFKVYAVVSGKLQKLTANVTGVLVDGVGYGTAEIKKGPSCRVLVAMP